MIKQKLFLFDNSSRRKPPTHKVDCKKDLHRYVCNLVMIMYGLLLTFCDIVFARECNINSISTRLSQCTTTRK